MPQATCPKCKTVFEFSEPLTDHKAQCTGCQAWLRVATDGTAADSKPPATLSDSRPPAPRLDPRNHRDAFVEALNDVRNQIGKPGRDLTNPVAGQAVARHGSAEVGDYVLSALLGCEPFLIEHGQVVWAAVIDAESALYQPGFGGEERPGLATAMIATDPRFGHLLTPLVACASALRRATKESQHDDPAVATFARSQCKEWGTWHGLRAPMALTGHVPCTVVTVVHEARHLPNGMLGGGFYPVLAHPLMPTAMMVPCIFWSRKMQMLWEQPLEPATRTALELWRGGAITRELISPESGHARMTFKGPISQIVACQAFHELIMVGGNDPEHLLVDGYFPNDPIAASGELLRTACRAWRTRSESMKKRFDKLLPYVMQYRGKHLVKVALELACPIRESIPKPKWRLFRRAPRPA